MVLVDTNVFVALLVRNTKWFALASELFARDQDWRSESHSLVELGNVLLRLTRADEIRAHDALAKLSEAEVLFGDGLMQVAHTEALTMALEKGASAYDARFLVAARELGLRLITEDVKLRHAAPELTQSLEKALAG